MVIFNNKTKVPVSKEPMAWRGLALIALYITIIGGSWYVGNRRAVRYNAEERNKLVKRTLEIVNAINPKLIKQLTFTLDDRGAPAFEQIIKQMTAHKAAMAMQCRGIWSVVMRNEKMVFGPETYPLDDSMASPPGTVYEEPPDKLCSVFKNSQTVVEGPYTDEYGVFVGCFSPILDSHSGEILMVVGVDIEAERWQANLNIVRRGPILVAIALLFLLSVGAFAMYLRNRRMKITS